MPRSPIEAHWLAPERGQGNELSPARSNSDGRPCSRAPSERHMPCNGEMLQPFGRLHRAQVLVICWD
eukprot:2045412-Amphidinium_carterae.1